MRSSGGVPFVALRRRHRSGRRVRASTTSEDRRPESVDAVTGRRHECRAEGGRVEAGGQRRGAGDARRVADADAAEHRAAVGAAAAALDLQGGKERRGEWEMFVTWAVAVGVEELDERRLVLLADALEVEHLTEVDVGFVADVDQIGLHESFGRRGSDLERFEERVDFGHALGHALDVAGRCWCTRMVDVEDFLETFLQHVRVEEHLLHVSNSGQFKSGVRFTCSAPTSDTGRHCTILAR